MGLIKKLFILIIIIITLFLLSVHFVAVPYYVLLEKIVNEKKGWSIFNYEVEDPFIAYLYERVVNTFHNFGLDKKFYPDSKRRKKYLLNAFYDLTRYKTLIKGIKDFDKNYLNEFYELAKGTDYEVSAIKLKGIIWLKSDNKYYEGIEFVETLIKNTDYLRDISSAYRVAVSLYVFSNNIERGIQFTENVMNKHNITYNNEGKDFSHKDDILHFYIYLLYKNGEIERAKKSFKRFEKEVVEKYEREHNRKYSIRNSQFYIALKEAFG